MAPSEQVGYKTKLVAMATYLEKSEKLDQIKKIHANTFLSLIHISEPTRQAEISYAVFCLKKNSDLSSTPKTLSNGIKIAKISHGLCFAYD